MKAGEGMTNSVQYYSKPKFKSGAKYKISYIDSSGNRSERTIQVSRIFHSRNGNSYIKAYCDLRKESRTFRSDRILWFEEVKDTQTPFSVYYTSRGIQKDTQTRSQFLNKTISAPSTSSYSVPKKKKRGKKLFILLITIVFLYFIIQREELQPPPSPTPSPPAPKPTPAPDPVPRPKPVPKPAPPPNPEPENPILITQPDSANKNLRFTRRTGISNEKLLKLYAGADINESGKLSFREIKVFQENLLKRYTYKENDYALIPDEFITAGGGDCEDFALVTAGLITYWGGTAYIACLSNPSGGNGHAICLLYTEEIPENYHYYELYGTASTWFGVALPSKYYIPIDYTKVGGLENNLYKDWYIESIYVPENMYSKKL
jgi:hypothetical protein